MTDIQERPIWERLDTLTDEDLAYLTNAALAVIGDHSELMLRTL